MNIAVERRPSIWSLELRTASLSRDISSHNSSLEYDLVGLCAFLLEKGECTVAEIKIILWMHYAT